MPIQYIDKQYESRHYPSVIALVCVEDLSMTPDDRYMARIVRDDELKEIRTAENRICNHYHKDDKNRLIYLSVSKNVRFVSTNGERSNLVNGMPLIPRCTIQVIGRKANVWEGYDIVGFRSDMIWDVDRIYIDDDVYDEYVISPSFNISYKNYSTYV